MFCGSRHCELKNKINTASSFSNCIVSCKTCTKTTQQALLTSVGCTKFLGTKITRNPMHTIIAPRTVVQMPGRISGCSANWERVHAGKDAKHKKKNKTNKKFSNCRTVGFRAASQNPLYNIIFFFEWVFICWYICNEKNCEKKGRIGLIEEKAKQMQYENWIGTRILKFVNQLNLVIFSLNIWKKNVFRFSIPTHIDTKRFIQDQINTSRCFNTCDDFFSSSRRGVYSKKCSILVSETHNCVFINRVCFVFKWLIRSTRLVKTKQKRKQPSLYFLLYKKQFINIQRS